MQQPLFAEDILITMDIAQNNKIVYIRTDANSEIATGHVMRCMSIADELVSRGIAVVFLVSDDNSKNIIITMNKNGYNYSFKNIEVLNSDYKNPIAELDRLVSFINEADTEQIVFLADSYFIDNEYYRLLRKKAGKFFKICCIDDFGNEALDVDIVINYNISSTAARYIYAEKLLTGTKYTPLRPQFKNRKHAGSIDIKNILISTGGSDNLHIIPPLVNGILHDTDLKSIEKITVITGLLNADKDKLNALSYKEPRLKLLFNVSDMASLMEEADVAVTAAGTTMYELCAVNTPSISIQTAQNQKAVIRDFIDKGLTFFAGNLLSENKTDVILEAVKGIKSLNEHEKRKSMSDKMAEYVDGRGAERIALELF